MKRLLKSRSGHCDPNSSPRRMPVLTAHRNNAWVSYPNWLAVSREPRCLRALCDSRNYLMPIPSASRLDLLGLFFWPFFAPYAPSDKHTGRSSIPGSSEFEFVPIELPASENHCFAFPGFRVL